MNENAVVVLGSLLIFGFVTIAVIALVYNRAIEMKASDKAIELKTNTDIGQDPSRTERLTSDTIRKRERDFDKR